MVLWAALAGGASVACQSDAGAICEKLFGCHILKDVPTSSDNPDGFSRDICESQVESELDALRRQQCADCIDAHSCAEIAESCRPVCAPQY